MRLPRLMVFVSCLFLAACDAAVGLSGVWSGGIVGGYTLNLTLTETELGVISGSGRFFNPNVINNPYIAVTVTGTHSHPAVGLHLVFTGTNFPPTNFSGALDQTLTVMRGALFGSGFIGDSIRFARNTPAIAGRITAP